MAAKATAWPLKGLHRLLIGLQQSSLLFDVLTAEPHKDNHNASSNHNRDGNRHWFDRNLFAPYNAEVRRALHADRSVEGKRNAIVCEDV